jgi:hypothetical protein
MKKQLLLATLAAAMAGGAWADETYYVDLTTAVGTDQAAWNGTGVFEATVTTDAGATVQVVESYNGDDNPYSAGAEPLHQKLTNLAAGTYVAELYATANHARGTGISADATDVAYVYARTADLDNTTWVTARDEGWFYAADIATRVYTVTATVGDDGALELGLHIEKGSSVNWCTIQIKSLKLEATAAVAMDDAVLRGENVLNDALYANVTGLERSNLQTAIADRVSVEAINEAIATFVAAVDAYDDFADLLDEVSWLKAVGYYSADYNSAIDSVVNANIQTAADAEKILNDATLMQTLINAYISAAYVDGADRTDLTHFIVNPIAADDVNGWTVTTNRSKFEVRSDEGECPVYRDGTSSKYFDGGSTEWSWEGTDWTIEIAQTTASALPAGRYRFSITARGREDLDYYNCELSLNSGKVAEMELSADGNESAAHYGRGWYESFVDFTVSEESPLTITVKAGATPAWQWYSFTNLRLYSIPDNSGIEAVRADNTVADTRYYDLYGRRVANPTPGIYVANGRKVVVK